MMRRPECTTYIVDYCAFGTPWRARTRLNMFNVKCPALEGAKCKGRGTCSSSGKPHYQLDGPTGKGGFLTRQKQ
eukprot:8961217-Pyramimonas_sp.AAC.1